MKILFIPPSPFSFCYGGTEVQIEKTKEELEKLGHQVKIIDFLDRSLLDWADAIHLFGGWGPGTFLWLKMILGRKPIIYSTIFYWDKLWRKVALKIMSYVPETRAWWYKKLIQQVDLVLPNSQAEAKQLQQLFGVLKDKIQIVPNGVEEDFKGDNPLAFRQKYLADWPLDASFILTVARLEKRKNILNLMKAADELGVYLVIIGAPNPNLKEKSYLEKIKAFSQGKKKIKFLGQIPRLELKNAYQSCSVFALVSYFETPGLSSLEAGLNGANLVLGKCQPVKEYFQNYAWLVNQGEESIKSGLKQALTEERNYYHQAEYILKNYTWRKTAELTSRAYQKVLE